MDINTTSDKLTSVRIQLPLSSVTAWDTFHIQNRDVVKCQGGVMILHCIMQFLERFEEKVLESSQILSKKMCIQETQTRCKSRNESLSCAT